MKSFAARSSLLRFGFVAVAVSLFAVQAQAQDLNLKPTYGSIKLRAGFTPDPVAKSLLAGGGTRTTRGGVGAWVANAPDFQVYYTAGNFPLTFYALSKSDTTLLINLPNGTWLANDDGGEGLNPLLRLPNPPSGRYDIWVGTFGQQPSQATLYITELK